MLVMCSIVLAVNVQGLTFVNRVDVQGKVLSENDTKYLVNFSKGVKEYPIVGQPSNYSKILVNKSECVEMPKK